MNSNLFAILVSFLVAFSNCKKAHAFAEDIMFSDYYVEPKIHMTFLEGCNVFYLGDGASPPTGKELPDVGKMYKESIDTESKVLEFNNVVLQCQDFDFGFDYLRVFFGDNVPARVFKQIEFLPESESDLDDNPELKEKLLEAPLGRSYKRLSGFGWKLPEWKFNFLGNYVFQGAKPSNSVETSLEFNFQYLLCSPNEYLVKFQQKELRTECAVNQKQIWLKTEPLSKNSNDCRLKTSVMGYHKFSELDSPIPIVILARKTKASEEAHLSCEESYRDIRFEVPSGLTLAIFYTLLNHLDILKRDDQIGDND